MFNLKQAATSPKISPTSFSPDLIFLTTTTTTTTSTTSTIAKTNFFPSIKMSLMVRATKIKNLPIFFNLIYFRFAATAALPALLCRTGPRYHHLSLRHEASFISFQFYLEIHFSSNSISRPCDVLLKPGKTVSRLEKNQVIPESML